MAATGPHAAIRFGAAPARTSFVINAVPPRLVTRDEDAGPARRTRLWEFNGNLHCSIIGTCLSTSELRQVLRKLGLAPPDSTDHDLHATAVTLAGRHDTGAKLLNKALDQSHRLAINHFAKVSSEDAVRGLWRDAVRRGEIPGAYWAVLTHPATTQSIIRDAFGDVHMLSHLVGAANRADIRRLCQLEADKAELEAKLARQQAALREAVVTRDAKIRDLQEALTRQITASPDADPPGGADETIVLRQLVSDLERRLASEARRRAASEAQLTVARADAARDRAARAAAERDIITLRNEINAIETSLIQTTSGQPSDAATGLRLDGMTLLYVGGRPQQVAHIRAAVERLGAVLLHHDGGVENHPNLLPGLASRADLVFFPVDCVSHDAVHAVKALCRQGGKRFVPLRSASVTALLAALGRPDLTGLADAAD
jgi:hypothetical protein